MEELTNCETMVMQAIWNAGEDRSIQEITEAVNQAYEKDWKVQTVSTFLSKMVKKGYLEMRREGRSFLYHPLVSEKAYQSREIEKCVSFWGKGKVSHILSTFSDTHGLTKEEKEEIRRLLDGLE